MSILLVLTGFILAFILIFCYEYMIKLIKTKPRNRIHFYVARDKDSSIYLYLGKPHRGKNAFHLNCDCEFILASEREFKKFNLNVDNFKELKWEDEPVEVFLNMDD